jgi:hypothetical protein
MLAVDAGADSFVQCFTYESGPFADSTICEIENYNDNTCTISIDGVECDSCAVITCNSVGGFDRYTDFDLDCSNIIQGETWNLCTDDIPETSLFIVAGINDLFTELTCGDDDSSGDNFQDIIDANPGGDGSEGSDPRGGDSGGVAQSFHALSMVGLVVAVAAFC